MILPPTRSAYRPNLQTTVKSKEPSLFLALGILFALTLMAYWNSFHAPFVFDDLVTIQRNAMVRFREINWSIFGIFGARFILMFSFMLNFWWSGQQVWSYHVVNFVLHVLNGFMVFLLAERIFKK